MTKTKSGFVTVTGGRVWYEIVGLDKESAIPLLALHGGPGYPHQSVRALEELADERPIVFYDQLGCGRSDRPDDLSLWTVDKFVQELAAVRQSLNLSKVHILGHSWGTILAVDYMLTKPSGVASLILASPCISIPHWLADADRLRLALPTAVQETLRHHESAGTTDSAAYQAAKQAYAQQFICRLNPKPQILHEADAACGQPVYAKMWGPAEFYMKGGTLIDYDRSDRLSELSVPVLFTCGRHDESTPETLAWYHSLCPRSQMQIFEESAHFPHLEETAAYLQLIRQFLQAAENA